MSNRRQAVDEIGMPTSPNAHAELPHLVRQLRGIVGQLEYMFPQRRFTLDGHLLGSIGEVLAAQLYGLELLSMAGATHDATTNDGLLVQIKVTQGSQVGLRGEPEHLLVLQFGDDGSVTEAYNGPGQPAWEASGKMQRNGQRPIRLSRLRQLMASVAPELRLPQFSQ
jgi:hypothetical protein